jgi:hypothetical protein
MHSARGRTVVSAFALVTCAVLAQPASLRAQEPPVFADIVQPVPPLQAENLMAGDIDGDGLADVACVLQTSVKLWRGTPDGLSPTALFVGSPVTLRAGRLADLDDDGLADLVLLAQNQPEALVAWSLGDGTFTSLASFPLSTKGGAVVAGDVDGDGQTDLLVSQLGYSRLEVLPGLGNHQFGPAFDTHVATNCYTLALGDIDADGTLDLLSLSYPGPFTPTISTSHGVGGGRFALPTELFSGTSAASAVFMDVDQDGLDDVVRADASDSIKLQLGQPDGSVAPPTVLANVPGVRILAVGDFTGDSLPDLLATLADPGTVELLRQTGSGVVPDPDGKAFVYDTMAELLAADVDGDGLADVIGRESLTESVAVLGSLQAGGFRNGYVVNATQNDALVLDADGDGRPDLLSAVTGTPSGRLRFGQPNGTFGTLAGLVSLDLGPSPFRLFAGDVDADGDVDVLVVQGLLTPGARWLVNDGHGVFTPMPTTTVPGTLRDAAATDLDGDGRLDVVLATASPSALVPLLSSAGAGLLAQPSIPLAQTPGQVAAGDFDGSGWQDVAIIGGTTVQLFQLQPAGPPISTSLPAGGSVKAVALGNFDGNGRGDLMVMVLSSNHVLLTWYENDGGGVPVSKGTFEVGPSVPYDRMILGDVDGDGDGELVVSGTNPDFNSACAVIGASGGAPSIDEVHGLPEPTVRLALADADGDGVLDLQVLGSTGAPIQFLPNAHPRWQRFGHSLAGGAGLSRLEGVGTLEAGKPVVLSVEGALPAAPGMLVLGASVLNAPFKGGVMVPDADLLLPGLVTDAQGALTLAGNFPPGVPSGSVLAAQVWFKDGAEPKGWSATTGVAGTAP